MMISDRNQLIECLDRDSLQITSQTRLTLKLFVYSFEATQAAVRLHNRTPYQFVNRCIPTLWTSPHMRRRSTSTTRAVSSRSTRGTRQRPKWVTVIEVVIMETRCRSRKLTIVFVAFLTQFGHNWPTLIKSSGSTAATTFIIFWRKMQVWNVIERHVCKWIKRD